MESTTALNTTLIAQRVVCAYPVSDIYAPSPRFLYYAVLALVFLLPGQGWIAKIWLGAATTYAATAALNAFIIVAGRGSLPNPELVSIPLIQDTSPIALLPATSGVDHVTVQPDALELDLDAITAIVVTACLVSLPLQAWSRAVRSSNVVRYMVLVWNAVMLAAAICVLVAWPDSNTAPKQYRFCFDRFLDPRRQANHGWQSEYWRGSWNSTIWNIFTNPDSVWLELSDNCFYPCFNTSQIIRPSTSLVASVKAEGQTLAKLHDPERFRHDYFSFIIYAAIAIFTGAQLCLMITARLNLCSRFVPIHDPHRLWRDWRLILKGLTQATKQTLVVVRQSNRWLTRAICLRSRTNGTSNVDRLSFKDLLAPIQLVIDVGTTSLLIASLTLFPLTIIGFTCWIEWYIRNDGKPNESPQQVGQWSPLVSVAVVLIAGFLSRFKTRLASSEELRQDIEMHEDHLAALRARLIAKDMELERRESLRRPTASPLSQER